MEIVQNAFEGLATGLQADTLVVSVLSFKHTQISGHYQTKTDIERIRPRDWTQHTYKQRRVNLNFSLNLVSLKIISFTPK